VDKTVIENYESGKEAISLQDILQISQILKKSMLYFIEDTEDVMVHIIDKWKYDDERAYTRIPLIKKIDPNSIVSTVSSSSTLCNVPIDCIENYNSVLATLVSNLETTDTNLPQNFLIVIANIKPEVGDIVLAYDRQNKFMIRTYSMIKDKVALISSNAEFYDMPIYPDIDMVKIYGNVIYFQKS
jgi:SOS-response transcriptional repressor LexA